MMKAHPSGRCKIQDRYRPQPHTVAEVPGPQGGPFTLLDPVTNRPHRATGSNFRLFKPRGDVEPPPEPVRPPAPLQEQQDYPGPSVYRSGVMTTRSRRAQPVALLDEPVVRPASPPRRPAVLQAVPAATAAPFAVPAVPTAVPAAPVAVPAAMAAVSDGPRRSSRRSRMPDRFGSDYIYT